VDARDCRRVPSAQAGCHTRRDSASAPGERDDSGDRPEGSRSYGGSRARAPRRVRWSTSRRRPQRPSDSPTRISEDRRGIDGWPRRRQRQRHEPASASRAVGKQLLLSARCGTAARAPGRTASAGRGAREPARRQRSRSKRVLRSDATRGRRGGRDGLVRRPDAGDHLLAQPVTFVVCD
jgi:hypothetical protein